MIGNYWGRSGLVASLRDLAKQICEQSQFDICIRFENGYICYGARTWWLGYPNMGKRSVRPGTCPS